MRKKPQGYYSKKTVKVIIFIILLMCAKFNVGNFNNTKVDEKSKSNYTINDILFSKNHPRLGDSYEETQKFYDNFNDSRINYDHVTSSLKEEPLISIWEHPIYNDYFGDFEIIINDDEYYDLMSIDKGINLAMGFMCEDFNEIYFIKMAFKHEQEDFTRYTMSLELTDYGKAQQKENNKIFRHFNLTIVDCFKKKRMVIYTSYGLHGDEDVGWIERNTTSWDIDLNQYFQ